ncbi:MAG: AAA family ATPase [Planctomycetota bacterium]
MSYSLVTRVLDKCLRANQPMLITGPHGCGKSEIVQAAASRWKIGFLGLDLSAAEPVDLLGLPSTGPHGTTYLAPACLPRDEKSEGVIFFDEINRSSRQVRAALLNLITSRKIELSGYTLPAGWRIIAACNPSGTDYHTDELDPAFSSRFVKCQLEPEVRGWVAWGRENNVHPDVASYVGGLQKFSAEANPRAWTMLSSLMLRNPDLRDDAEVLTACAEGLVGSVLGRAFVGCLMTGLRPLSLERILSGEANYRQTVDQWTRAKRTDLFTSTAETIRVEMLDVQNVNRITGGKPANIVAGEIVKFAKLCPADISKGVLESAERYRYNANTAGARK